MEGVPGTAKTLMVQSVAHSIELQFGRVQFTIDLLPSDIIGSEILDKDSGDFRVHKGPIFTNLLLADEINRASPKVQSALLEAMQERKVTIGDNTFTLPSPFLVIATQNPVEQAGTFDLPEAQLDRFLMRHRLGYLDSDDEAEVLRRALKLKLIRDKDGGAMPMTAFDAIDKSSPLAISDLTSAMEKVLEVHVSEVFVRHCVDLVNRTRNHPDIELGGSPRAGIALVTASRARAFLHGRDYVVPEDIFALAEDIVLHRIRLSYEAVARGRKGDDVLAEILDQLA
ncbi:MAG: ATPase [Planctomycetota bacterium]|nr:MAG: ATPase [Planctomycetota bacterium]